MLNKVTKNIITIIITGTILGCTTTSISMDKDIKIEPTTADSVLIITQDNIDVTTSPSFIGGSPDLFTLLVVSIVNASRSGEAKRTAKAIINALEDYDFRLVMNEALSGELKKVNSICFSDNNYIDNNDSKARKEILYNNVKSDAVLFLYVDYKLENGTLEVRAKAEISPKAERLSQFKMNENAKPPNNLNSAIYRNDFLYVCPTITSIADLKQSLNYSAKNISLQLVADLNDTK